VLVLVTAVAWYRWVGVGFVGWAVAVVAGFGTAVGLRREC
jgi:hypothetical protein